MYSTSYLTAKEIKAKKSMQAYNNFLSSWVLETAIKRYEEKCLVIGTVSQVILILHFQVAFCLFRYTLCNSDIPSFLLPLLPNRPLFSCLLSRLSFFNASECIYAKVFPHRASLYQKLSLIILRFFKLFPSTESTDRFDIHSMQTKQP